VSFLLTFTVTDPLSGARLHDETVVVEASPFYGFEKGFRVLGEQLRLGVRFDPPLTPITEEVEA
jgi:hypothetical protein